MESILITKDDIRETWSNFDKNLKESQVNPFILKAQRSDLKPFLGASLYFDFVTNIADSKYQDLLNGVTYTYKGNSIFFDGIKPLLAAFSYMRILKGININVNRGSVSQKDSEESTNHEQGLINVRVNEAESEALRNLIEVRQFIQSNIIDYDLYEDSSDNQKSSGFGIIRVPGHKRGMQNSQNI